MRKIKGSITSSANKVPLSVGRNVMLDPVDIGLQRAVDIAYRAWCARRGLDPGDVRGLGHQMNRPQKYRNRVSRTRTVEEPTNPEPALSGAGLEVNWEVSAPMHRTKGSAVAQSGKRRAKVQAP